MKIGSHNSLTYATPRKWWMRIFAWAARCQEITVEEQFNMGIRLFDFRYKINKKGLPTYAHGIIEYDMPIDEPLEFLNGLATKDDPIYVRILQENRPDEHVEEFAKWCEEIQAKYPNLIFFCGRNKYNWKIVYDFPANPGPTFLDKYSSNNQEKYPVTGTYLDDLYPKLYALLNNRKNIKAGTDREFLMIDFINIR